MMSILSYEPLYTSVYANNIFVIITNRLKSDRNALNAKCLCVFCFSFFVCLFYAQVWPFSFPHKLDSIRGSTSAAAAGSTNGNNCSSIGNVHVHGLTHWLTATRLGATTSINPTTALEQHQHNHNDVHLQQEATSCNENGSMNSSRCNYMSNTTAHG